MILIFILLGLICTGGKSVFPDRFGRQVFSSQYGVSSFERNSLFHHDVAVESDEGIDNDKIADSLLNQVEIEQLSLVEESNQLQKDKVGNEMRKLQWHGTTTLAFKYSDDIVICVDSKASTGEYIASKTVKKVIPITESIVATMAGGAADCYHNIREVATSMLVEKETAEIDITVKGVAKILRNVILQNLGKIQLGSMVAGIDPIFGSQLYYVDSNGNFLEGDRFCVGSGSVLAYSALDSALAQAQNSSMPLSEAIYHALWAVRHATVRDAFSGGYINAFVIQKEDKNSHLNARIRHLLHIDCKELDMPLDVSKKILLDKEFSVSTISKILTP